MFISYEFILFLLVLFAVYYVIPKRFQWILLLIANFLFYYSAGAFYPLFILATSVTVWFAGVCIDRQEGQWQSYQAEIKAGKIEKPSRDEKKAVKAKIGGKKKRIMLVCLLFNLGILAVLKYTNFVIDNVNTVLDAAGRTELPYADLILPLGIFLYVSGSCISAGCILGQMQRTEKSAAFYTVCVFFSTVDPRTDQSLWGSVTDTLCKTFL